MERQRLAQEEKRVAEAAADHRSRGGERTASSTRARAIQNRVQAYLQEGRQSPVKKTAAGYGHYTDTPEDEQAPPFLPDSYPAATVGLAKSPSAAPLGTEYGLDVAKQRQQPTPGLMPLPASTNRTGPRPAAKPKPVALRTRTPVQGIGRAATAPSSTGTEDLSSAGSQGSRLAALLARDQEGVATPGRSSPSPATATTDMPGPADIARSPNDDNEQDDWEAEFSKRYPSLGGIGMIETEIEGFDRRRPQQGLRVKDV